MFKDPDHEQMLAVIEYCHERNLAMPCLTLTYTLIDSFAWLLYGPEESGVKKRFTKWVDRFFLPHFRCGCTALDLYAARCSILHGLSWESQLSQSRHAKVLLYFSSKDEQSIKQASSKIFSADHTIMVSMGALTGALNASYASFLEHIGSNDKARQKVEKRLGKRYAYLTTAQFEKLGAAFEKIASSNPKLQPTEKSGG